MAHGGALGPRRVSPAEAALVTAVLGTGAAQTDLLPALMAAYAHADHVVGLDVDRDQVGGRGGRGRAVRVCVCVCVCVCYGFVGGSQGSAMTVHGPRHRSAQCGHHHCSPPPPPHPPPHSPPHPPPPHTPPPSPPPPPSPAVRQVPPARLHRRPAHGAVARPKLRGQPDGGGAGGARHPRRRPVCRLCGSGAERPHVPAQGLAAGVERGWGWGCGWEGACVCVAHACVCPVWVRAGGPEAGMAPAV